MGYYEDGSIDEIAKKLGKRLKVDNKIEVTAIYLLAIRIWLVLHSK